MRLPGKPTRWSVAARVAAAVIGGYALAAAAVVLISAALVPWLGRVDAVWLGTMPGALFYAGGIVTAFAASSAWRAWAWLLGIAALLAALRLLVPA